MQAFPQGAIHDLLGNLDGELPLWVARQIAVCNQEVLVGEISAVLQRGQQCGIGLLAGQGFVRMQDDALLGIQQQQDSPFE